MSVNIAVEEYVLLVSFKNQLKGKSEEYHYVLKEKERKEKEIIELTNFYNNEKNKNIKQLNILQEEINRCVNTLDNLKEKVMEEKALINTLEGRVCAFRKVLVEKHSKN